MTEPNPYEKLVVDEKTAAQRVEAQIGRISQVLSIEKPSGAVIFKNFKDLTTRQGILGVLVGKYCATKVGIKIKDSLSVSQIASEIGKPMTAISGDLKNLMDSRLIEKLPDRSYRISHQRIDEIVDALHKTKTTGGSK